MVTVICEVPRDVGLCTSSALCQRAWLLKVGRQMPPRARCCAQYRLVCLSLADLAHHVNSEKAFCRVYTSTTVSYATQGVAGKQPKEVVSLKKKSLMGFFELFFSTQNQQVTPKSQWTHMVSQGDQPFSLFILETSRGGLQVFSCHTFLTSVLVFRPEHFIPISVLPVPLSFLLNIIQLRQINSFQCFDCKSKVLSLYRPFLIC